jgi:quinoprotein glucose dehydrogenase
VFTEETLSRRTPEVHAELKARFAKLKAGDQFVPPSTAGTVIFPGFDGGGEWGAPAFDPETGLLYVNANEMAWVLRLIPNPPAPPAVDGRQLYERNCASCHKRDLKGSPPEFPALLDTKKKFAEPDLRDLIRVGQGRMPGFPQLGRAGHAAIARYLLTGEAGAALEAQPGGPLDLKYSFDGYNKFLDKDGFPGITPPWGTLNAIDLNSGEIRWKIPFGEIPGSGLSNTGSENYGGPIVTASGLLFIAATNHDKKFRVFDKRTGDLLWETALPAAGNATPAMFEVNGRQMVVIGAGGGKTKDPSGASYHAFALPEERP